MMSLVSFCCKTWMPFHAWSKNILELRKLFPISLSKWVIQTIQELSHLLHAPTAGAKAPNPLVRAQTCHTGPLQPPGAPGFLQPLGPWAQQGPNTSREAPGIWLETAWRDQALSPWVGLVRDIPVTSEITLGLLWLHLHSVEGTTDIYSTVQTKNTLLNALPYKKTQDSLTMANKQ